MTIPKQISTKIFLATILGLIIVCSSILYVIAQTPTTTIWLSSGVYPSDGSYTIWVEGSNYFAKNEYGEIPSGFSGTNASALTLSCVNSLTSGGKIFFKAGTYDFDSQVAVPYPIIFEGEGTTQTQIRLTSASIYCFAVTANDVVFRDIYFNGNGQTGGSGLRFGAGANFALVSFCRFYNFEDTAIVCYGSAGTNIVGRIEYSTIWTCDYGIKINSDATYWSNDWVLLGNRIQTCTTQAIQVGTGAGASSGCRILSNTIENTPTGIRLGGNSDYARVFFNRIENATSYGIYILNAPNNMHIAHNFLSDANITVSSIGTVHVIAENDGNLDYVSMHHYFSGTSFPTSPTPVEGSLFWKTDTNVLYVYDGASWDACS